jgi:[calcium/calmodulin-dependent protein kinase] kinase
MIAINKFKGLISKSRVGTPQLNKTWKPKKLDLRDVGGEKLGESTAVPNEETPPRSETRPRHKSIAEEAADLIEARKAYLASTDHTTRQQSSSQGEGKQAPGPTGAEPQFLGIGVGGRDDFSTVNSTADIVSDSPTGIDFDIYDRAFGAEVERIRSAESGSSKTTYLTRFVGEKEKYLGDESMIMEAGRNLPAAAASGMSKASSAAARTLAQMGLTHRGASEVDSEEGGKRELLREKFEAKRTETHDGIMGVKEKANQFADLVMGAIHGLGKGDEKTKGNEGSS